MNLILTNMKKIYSQNGEEINGKHIGHPKNPNEIPKLDTSD